MDKTRKMVFTGLCIALGVVLPLAFHTIPNAGSIFLPMHIPVLLCGLLCGPLYGLICGAAAPLLSSLITGMPPMAILPGMLCELAVYGLITGVLIGVIPAKNRLVSIYCALIGAMLAGRIVSGLLNALIFRAGKYSLQMWLTAGFVTAVPGIVIQLIAIPVIVTALGKAGLSNAPQKAEAKNG